MLNAELVWIRDCEFCGREHRRQVTCTAESIDCLQAEVSGFERDCEQWFEVHLARVKEHRLVA